MDRPKVLQYCLICKAQWKGGHQVPGKPMQDGLRVFYSCGASLCIRQNFQDEAYTLLIKGCGNNLEEDNGSIFG